MSTSLNKAEKCISWKDAIIRATEELKYYFDIKNSNVFLEKVEPTDKNGWIIMLSYLSDQSEKWEAPIDHLLKANPLFSYSSKQYISIYLDMEGNFLKLKKANAPE